MPTVLHLIRHGETEWSLTGQHTGRTEIPLTQDGRASARDLREPLSRVPFSRVICSPRVRARQTCELAGLGGAMELDPDLSEWDYGDYEGQRSLEILDGRPDWNLFEHGCPGGESVPGVSDRADRLLARLIALEEPIAVFTHGHFGRVLGARWIGLGAGEGRHLLLDPASISVLGFEHDRADSPVIVRWNDRVRHGGSATGPQ
jgi:probable phosphoglycerate mutase